MNTLILESNNYNESAIKLYKSIGKVYKNYHKQKKYKNVQILVCRLAYFIDENLVNKFPNLKYVISNTTGLSHIDTNFLKKKKIKLVSLNNCKKEIKNIQSTTEINIGLLISLCRGINQNVEILKKKKIWNRYLFNRESLKNKTLGIIGFGRIGRQVKRVAKSLNLKIIFNDNKSVLKSQKNYKSLNYLIKKSDIISINADLNSSSYNLIDNKEFDKMKRGVFIINTARSEIINSKALIKNIKNKKIAGYACDVLDHEDKNYKKNFLFKIYNSGKYNLIITPHIGGATKDSMTETEHIVSKFFLSKYVK